MRKQWMRGLKSLTLIVLAVCMAVMAGACGKKDGGGLTITIRTLRVRRKRLRSPNS